MRLRSLRARLVTGLMALATVGLVAMGAITYAQQRGSLLERVDQQVRDAGPAVERALGHGVDRGPFGGFGRGGIKAGRPPELSLPPGVYGELRDPSGATVGSPVVLTTGEQAPPLPAVPADLAYGELITVDAQGDSGLQYRVGADPARGGGSVVVAVPLTGVEDQLAELLLVEGAVIAGILLAMALAGVWVVRVGLRPLDRIGETAGRIAAGDLSQRVEPADEETEVGRLGTSLNKMLGQIEQAFAERTASEERLRRFLADASHELRTPLASIRGYAELYRMGAARDEAESEKAMSRIEQEAARMGVLVEDLLVLARLDEVREQVREPVDVAELASDAVADARAMAPARDVALDAGEDVVVSADGDQLRQVLANLLRNALVHTPAGTPVEVGVRRDDGHVRIEVRDHGPGLPVQEGDALFERFWRADPARGRGPAGAGLGLAIVHGIVTAHGGTVHAANAAGGGAVFTVELPAAVTA